jgi:serine/threonine protein kinase
MSESEIKRSTYVSNKIRYVGNQDLKHYIFSEFGRTHSVSHLYVTHLYLLNGLKKLADHNIIHYDIKPNNIMYDEKLEIPIIIDFGLSIDMHKLTPHNYRNIFYVYDTYTYWCIDIMMCNYIFQVITYERSRELHVTKEELDKIYEDFIYGVDRKSTPDNDTFNIHIRPIDPTYKSKYDAYFEQFLHKSWFFMYEHLIRFRSTWDNYSLAISYLVMLDDIYMEMPGDITKKDHRYAELLSKIVYSMPNERPSIPDTIQQVKRVFMHSKL